MDNINYDDILRNCKSFISANPKPEEPVPVQQSAPVSVQQSAPARARAEPNYHQLVVDSESEEDNIASVEEEVPVAQPMPSILDQRLKEHKKRAKIDLSSSGFFGSLY